MRSLATFSPNASYNILSISLVISGKDMRMCYHRHTPQANQNQEAEYGIENFAG